MKLTQALSVRNLLAKLHSPLPQTPRESNQLLKLLTSSLRKQLDAEHPSPLVNNETLRKKAQSSVPRLGIDPATATHHHLDSILVHPLLQMNSLDALSIPSPLQAAVRRMDQLIASDGDVESVVATLFTYCRDRKRKEPPLPGQKMGDRLVFWLSSKSEQQRLSFWSDAKAMDAAVSVMGMDGMEEMVWEWLKRMYEMNAKSLDLEALAAEDNLVSLLMRESIRNRSIEGAAQHFVQACRYRVESGRAEVSFRNPQSNPRPLISSWKRLTAAILYRRSKHGINPALYDQVFAYDVPFAYLLSPDKSILMPYHPTKPSAQMLYHNIQSADFVQRFHTWHSNLKSEGFKKMILEGILDAAELSLSQQQYTQAQELLNFAESQYPQTVSSNRDLSTAGRLERARRLLHSSLVFRHDASLVGE